MLKYFNGCLVHINPDRAFLPPIYLTWSRIQNVPLTCLLSTEWCLSASGDPGTVGHQAQFNANFSQTPHFNSPCCTSLWRLIPYGDNRELYCWRRKLMVHIPISSDLKSPESIVSPQPSPSAAALSKEKWPVMFMRTGCVAQNLSVESLHLPQWVKHNRYMYKKDWVEGCFILLQHGETEG